MSAHQTINNSYFWVAGSEETYFLSALPEFSLFSITTMHSFFLKRHDN